MLIKIENLIIGAGPSGLTAGYSILKIRVWAVLKLSRLMKNMLGYF